MLEKFGGDIKEAIVSINNMYQTAKPYFEDLADIYLYQKEPETLEDVHRRLNLYNITLRYQLAKHQVDDSHFGKVTKKVYKEVAKFVGAAEGGPVLGIAASVVTGVIFDEVLFKDKTEESLKDVSKAVFADVNSVMKAALDPTLSKTPKQRIKELEAIRAKLVPLLQEWEKKNPIFAVGLVSALHNLDYFLSYYKELHKPGGKALPTPEEIGKKIKEVTQHKSSNKATPKPLSPEKIQRNNEFLARNYGINGASSQEHAALAFAFDQLKANELVSNAEAIRDYGKLTSNFLLLAGQMFKSKTLSMVGLGAQYSATILSSGMELKAALLLKANPLSLAVLNPVYAMAMAGFSLFSLFRKKRESNGLNEALQAIMGELHQISQQIQALHSDMIHHFNIVFRNQAMLYQTMMQSFAHLERGMQEGFYTLKLQLSASFEQLRNNIQKTATTTHIALNQVFLRDYEILLNQIESYLTGGFSGRPLEERVHKFIDQNWITALEFWAKTGASSSLLTGLDYVYAHARDANPWYWMLQVLGSSNWPTDHLIGYVAAQLKQLLPADQFPQDIEIKSLINPVVWFASSEQYLEVRTLLLKHQYEYDMTGEEINHIVTRGRNFIRFIHFLQTNRQVYESIFQNYAEGVSELDTVIIARSAQHLDRLLKEASTQQIAAYGSQKWEISFPAHDIQGWIIRNEAEAIFNRYKSATQDKLTQHKRLITAQTPLLIDFILKFSSSNFDTAIDRLAEELIMPLNIFAYHGRLAQLKNEADYAHSRCSFEANGYLVPIDITHLLRDQRVQLPPLLLVAERLGIVHFDIYYSAKTPCVYAGDANEAEYKISIDLLVKDQRFRVATIEAQGQPTAEDANNISLRKLQQNHVAYCNYGISPGNHGAYEAGLRYHIALGIVGNSPHLRVIKYDLLPINAPQYALIEDMLREAVHQYKTQALHNFLEAGMTHLDNERIFSRIDACYYLLSACMSLAGFAQAEWDMLNTFWSHQQILQHLQNQIGTNAEVSLRAAVIDEENSAFNTIKSAVLDKVEALDLNTTCSAYFNSPLANYTYIILDQFDFFMKVIGLNSNLSMEERSRARTTSHVQTTPNALAAQTTPVDLEQLIEEKLTISGITPSIPTEISSTSPYSSFNPFIFKSSEITVDNPSVPTVISYTPGFAAQRSTAQTSGASQEEMNKKQLENNKPSQSSCRIS